MSVCMCAYVFATCMFACACVCVRVCVCASVLVVLTGSTITPMHALDEDAALSVLYACVFEQFCSSVADAGIQ
jgi:hypothetical protein